MDYKNYINKFEVPLTVWDTEEIFIFLENAKYQKVFQNVYLPPHPDDGGSGRVFKYDYTKGDYYRLIKRLAKEIDIVMTYPAGDVKVMKKYMKLGINRYMVSSWNNEYDELKKNNPQLIIERSIVGNAHNEEVDYRFDGMVIPYEWLLDIERIKKESKKIRLIALVNHNCRVTCPSLDLHPQRHLTQIYNEKFDHVCPTTEKTYFVPRQVVEELVKYVDAIKITDRLSPPDWYINYIDYYLGDKKLDSNNNPVRIEQNKTDKMFESSNMKTLTCRFECKTCKSRCY